MITLLERAVRSDPEATFLLDGFPRSAEQGPAFEKAIGGPPQFVMFLDVPHDVMIECVPRCGGGPHDLELSTRLVLVRSTKLGGKH